MIILVKIDVKVRVKSPNILLAATAHLMFGVSSSG
jgi:hypothetical protein